MSRLSSVVTAIANEEGVSVRTVQRWFEAGKFKGAYRTPGGHWRFRKLRRRRRQQSKESGKGYWVKDGHRVRFPPEEQWEQWKKSLVADVLRRIMVLIPYYDQAVKFAWLYAGINEHDLRTVLDPDPLTRRRNRTALKRCDYRKWQLLCQRKHVSQPNLDLQRYFLHAKGLEVTRRALASALGISIPTLYRRFGRENVQKACLCYSDAGNAGRSPAGRARHSALEAMFFDKTQVYAKG